MLTQVSEGMVIVQEGEVNMDLYKLVSGKAEVYVGYGTEKETIVGILSEGAYFGEMGFLSSKPAIYTIVMYSDGLLLRVTAQDFVRYIQENPRDIVAIMRHMADTMYTLKKNIELLTNDLNNMVDEKKNADEVEAWRQRVKASRLTKSMLMRNTDFNVTGITYDSET